MYSSKSDHTLRVHLSKFLTPQAKMGSRGGGGGGVDPPMSKWRIQCTCGAATLGVWSRQESK